MMRWRAKPVLAWAIVASTGKEFTVVSLAEFPPAVLLPGERVARVEIREIEEGQDDEHS